jgi:hypothetical protein
MLNSVFCKYMIFKKKTHTYKLAPKFSRGETQYKSQQYQQNTTTTTTTIPPSMTTRLHQQRIRLKIYKTATNPTPNHQPNPLSYSHRTDPPRSSTHMGAHRTISLTAGKPRTAVTKTKKIQKDRRNAHGQGRTANQEVQRRTAPANSNQSSKKRAWIFRRRRQPPAQTKKTSVSPVAR